MLDELFLAQGPEILILGVIDLRVEQPFTKYLRSHCSLSTFVDDALGRTVAKGS
jgi:hypothetical protein